MVEQRRFAESGQIHILDDERRIGRGPEMLRELHGSMDSAFDRFRQMFAR